MDELELLRIELLNVEKSELEILPDYGYSSKEEIIELINDEIMNLEEERYLQPEYTDEELNYERRNLCFSQGISRYC